MAKVVGLDIGNSALKAVFGEGEHEEMTIPTVVKFAENELTTGMEVDVKNIFKDIRVKITSPALSENYNGAAVIVGEAATGGREMVQKTQKHRSDLPVITSLAALAIRAAQESGGKSKKDLVATYYATFGMPIDYLTSEVKKTYEQRMKGSHIVEILTRGHERKVTVIIEEAVVLPEDAVFIFDQTLDYNGKSVGSDLENMNVLIVGIGQLTTDCGFVENQNYNHKKSFGRPLGVASTKDRFIHVINDELKKKGHIYTVDKRAELDRIIQNDLIIGELALSFKSEWDRTVREDMMELADWVMNEVTSRKIIAHRYFLIGGGTHFYKHYFLNAFSEYGMKFEIPNNPTFATARGLYKLGVSDMGFGKKLKSEAQAAAASE